MRYTGTQSSHSQQRGNSLPHCSLQYLWTGLTSQVYTLKARHCLPSTRSLPAHNGALPTQTKSGYFGYASKCQDFGYASECCLPQQSADRPVLPICPFWQVNLQQKSSCFFQWVEGHKLPAKHRLNSATSKMRGYLHDEVGVDCPT